MTASADVVEPIDRRLGAGRAAPRKALRYVFPDHWSFLLGEIALYAFVVLVATGIYLALFFEPDVSGTTSTTVPTRRCGRPVTRPTARRSISPRRARRAC